MCTQVLRNSGLISTPPGNTTTAGCGTDCLNIVGLRKYTDRIRDIINVPDCICLKKVLGTINR